MGGERERGGRGGDGEGGVGRGGGNKRRGRVWGCDRDNLDPGYLYQSLA